MKQSRITRTRAVRRREPAPLAPLPVVPASSTAAAGSLLGRIDRVLNGR